MSLSTATFVTHVRPDLDALLGVWIFSKFGNYQDYKIIFLPVGKSLDVKVNVFHIDTGSSQFDHHNRSDFTCAAKLVYEFLFKKQKDRALEMLVEYALKTDWYLVKDDENSPFALNSIIEGLNRLHPNDPQQVARSIFQTFDALYESLSLHISAEVEYKNGYNFESVFGKGFAIESNNPAVRDMAYKDGATILVFVDPVKGYKGFKAQSRIGLDLSKIYFLLKKLEPNSDWFLHSSHELLLCGSDKAPDRKLSSLSLTDLVEIISPHTSNFKSAKQKEPALS